MEKMLVATRIDEETHRRLRGVAEEQDRTVSYLLRKAVERLVDAPGQETARVGQCLPATQDNRS